MTQVRFLPPQLREVIRLDEEPASRAGAGELSVVGSSPTTSAYRKQHVPLAERQRCQASNLARRVRLPQGTLQTRVGSSAAERLPVKRQRVGSSPTRPSHIAGCLLVDRRGFEPRRRGFDSCTRNFDDGSNRTPMRDRSMAGRGALNAVMLVRVQLPQLRHPPLCSSDRSDAN